MTHNKLLISNINKLGIYQEIGPLIIHEEEMIQEYEPKLEANDIDLIKHQHEYNNEHKCRSPTLAIIRSIMIIKPPSKNWRCTNIFYMYTKSNEHACKFFIDGRSGLNIVSIITIMKVGFHI